MARFLIKDVSGRIEGPISSSELRRWVQSGRITRETMIQQEGRRSWHRAADVPAIAALLPPREEPEELGAEAPRSQDPAPIVYDFSDTPSDPTPAAGQPIEPGEAREYEVADSEEPQAQRPIHRPEAMSFQHAAKQPADPSCNGAAAANWYISEFNDRISQLKQDRMDAAAELARRRSLIGPAIQGVGAAIAALLLFLILPLLIQIERNTRAGSA